MCGTRDIALSGLVYGICHKAGLRPTLIESIPSGFEKYNVIQRINRENKEAMSPFELNILYNDYMMFSIPTLPNALKTKKLLFDGYLMKDKNTYLKHSLKLN